MRLGTTGLALLGTNGAGLAHRRFGFLGVRLLALAFVPLGVRGIDVHGIRVFRRSRAARVSLLEDMVLGLLGVDLLVRLQNVLHEVGGACGPVGLSLAEDEHLELWFKQVVDLADHVLVSEGLVTAVQQHLELHRELDEILLREVLVVEQLLEIPRCSCRPVELTVCPFKGLPELRNRAQVLVIGVPREV